MQSSSTQHYFAEEFNENFLFDRHPNEQLFFPSEPIFDQYENEEEIPPEETDMNDIPDTFYGTKTIDERKGQIDLSIGIESGLAGLQIKGKVRTLSPVLFYQTNTRYLIMCNNQLKALPAGLND